MTKAAVGKTLMQNQHDKNWGGKVNTNPAGLAPNINPQTAEPESIDFQARINSELEALNAAVTNFEQDGGRTAQALVDAQQEVTRIKAELFAAEQRLQALQAAGSALNKYNGVVSKAEGGFQKLVELLTKRIQNEILTQWYGHAFSVQAISADRKKDLSLCKRIQDLRKFVMVSSFDPRATALQVNKRADQIGTKLVELREHIAADQAKQKAK
jgi:hypothetical protein